MPSTYPWRRPVVVAALTMLAAGAGVGGWVLGRDNPATEVGPVPVDPAAADTIPLPPLADDASAMASFTGETALIQTFRDLSAPLLSLIPGVPAVERLDLCRRVAAELDAWVDPQGLVTAAAAVTDDVLAGLVLDDRRARSDTLVACGRSDVSSTDEAVSVVLVLDTLIQRRLQGNQ